MLLKGETNNHSGNILFRRVVEDFKGAYHAASKGQKPKVAAKLILHWRNLSPPGRVMAKSKTQDDVWEDIGDAAARRRASKSLGEKEKPSLLGHDFSQYPHSMIASALPVPQQYSYQQERPQAAVALPIGFPNAAASSVGSGGVKRSHEAIQLPADPGDMPTSFLGQLDQSDSSQQIPSFTLGNQHQQPNREGGLFTIKQQQQMLQQEDVLPQPSPRTSSQGKDRFSGTPTSSSAPALASMPPLETGIANFLGNTSGQLQRQEIPNASNEHSGYRSEAPQLQIPLHDNSLGSREASLAHGRSLNIGHLADTAMRSDYERQPQPFRQRQRRHERNDDNLYTYLPTAAELVDFNIFTSSSSSGDGGEGGNGGTLKDAVGRADGDLLDSG